VETRSQADRTLALVAQKGMLRARDLEAIGVPRMVLARLTAVGRLEKIGRGTYRLPHAPSSELESLMTVAARVPAAVFCLLTALQFHEMTSQLPRQVWIAMPRGSHVPRIDYPPLRMVQTSEQNHASGVEEHRHSGVVLRVTNVAKTVTDCFKHRNTIGLDVALEALKDALHRRKASTEDLWHYAKVGRVANVIRPYLEAIA